MENVAVSGVTVNRDEAKITVEDLPDQPGVAAQLFSALADSGIVVDMILQNQSWDGTTDVTFTVPLAERKRAVMVGDSTTDMLMAQRAGVGLRVAVLTGLMDRAVLAPLADVVLDSIGEIHT